MVFELKVEVIDDLLIDEGILSVYSADIEHLNSKNRASYREKRVIDTGYNGRLLYEHESFITMGERNSIKD